ncbi:MAG: serine/threonine-protein kinase [Myxococcota bacterium]
MTPERYGEVKALVVAALERPPSERARFVRDAAGDDEALRREVVSLLAEDAAPASIVSAGFVPPDALADALGLGSDAPLEDAPLEAAPLEAAPLEAIAREPSPFASQPVGEALPGPAVGLRVKHFELVRELGRGGMGQVFLARDTKLGRSVALKFLKLRGPDAVRRFLAEARATAQCQHENIVVIYEASEADGRPYLALEYLDGAPLGDRLAEGPVPPDEAVAIVIPVVRALVRAHALGIVHRDLKPDNIFVTRDGPVKVLDFGIAKLFESVELEAREELPQSGPGATLTLHGQLVGTVPYMSPEQWGAAEVDHRSDLWAVGILFWHMLVQQHPVSRPHRARLRAVLTRLDEPLPSLARAAPELDTRLVELVDRCLVKRKEARVASAAELLAGLEALAPGSRPAVSSAAPSQPRAPASGVTSERPWVLRVTAGQAWGAMFVLGWLLLGAALGLGVGTSYVRSLNWGPNYIMLLPLLVAVVVRSLHGADEALRGLGPAGMLLDATGSVTSRNEAWAQWRRRLDGLLFLGVPLVGGMGVSVAEWWQRLSLRPVPGEWWTESFGLGLAASLVQGLVFFVMILSGLAMSAFVWALRDLAAGEHGVRLAYYEHAEDGQGGYSRFREPLVGMLLAATLLYAALWLSSVESMALEMGEAAGPVSWAVLFGEGGLLWLGPAHYSTRMTALAVVCTLALLSLGLLAVHRVYWAAAREHAEGGADAPSPWLVPGLRLDVLFGLNVLAVACFVFFKLGLLFLVGVFVALLSRAGRVLSPNG